MNKSLPMQFKKCLHLVLFLSLFSVSVPSSYAVTPKPTPVPSNGKLSTDSADIDRIQRIKDIVAEKVAKLKLVEKRGIIGAVTEVSGMQVSVTDIRGGKRKIEVDELTKFNLSSKETTGISDLNKGEVYSFVGLYNKDTQKLLARDINTVNTIPVYFEGAIVSIDEDNYQIVVVDTKGVKKTVDIQSSTKTSLASSEGDLLRSGFSKLEVNERVLAVGFWDKKDNTMLSAIRLIHFDDVPPSKEMQAHVTSASESAR